jgi:hypothetical protein
MDGHATGMVRGEPDAHLIPTRIEGTGFVLAGSDPWHARCSEQRILGPWRRLPWAEAARPSMSTDLPLSLPDRPHIPLPSYFRGR